MTRAATTASLAVFATALRLGAQTGYYNLDSGRPNRIEDAAATALYALDIQLASLRAERFAGGAFRYRAEPKLSYGVLPFTELEVRVPVVHVQPPRASDAAAITGVASIGIGALRTLNLERSLVPAFALAAEILLPYGALSPPRHSYQIKALATKTTTFARFHVNLGAGTYSVQPPKVVPDTPCVSPRFLIAGGTDPCGRTPPMIYDVPCSRTNMVIAARTLCATMPAETLTVAATVPRTYGTHWAAAFGADHAFALQSTLLSADVVAERFIGLYALADWTAEVGARHQLTPRLTVDAGAARHFAGAIRSTSLTMGATVELSTRPWR